MDHGALLDGSDAQDRNASSHIERCAALKQHLRDAVLILESFDQTSQDREYSDLIQRFLSTFTAFPFPDLISQVDDAIKRGLDDISASIAQFAIRGAIPQESRPAGERTMPMNPLLSPGQERGHRTGRRLETVTIHFLKGNTGSIDLPRLVDKLNSVSTTAGGRVDSAQMALYIDPDSPLRQPHGAYRILLTCSNAFDSLFDGFLSLNPSSLWPRRCVVHLRRGGTTEYGLRAAIPLPLHALDSETERELQTRLLVAIKEVYPQRALGRQVGFITVTKELASGFYIFSGPIAQDLEDLVRHGPQTVPVRCPRVAALLVLRSGGDSFDVTISPFRLCDMPPEAMAYLRRDAENYFTLS